jgi:hypothetical protein
LRFSITVPVSSASTIACLLVVCMDRTLGRAHEARAHLDALGAQRKGRRHAAAVADATRRDDGNIGALAGRKITADSARARKRR